MSIFFTTLNSRPTFYFNNSYYDISVPAQTFNNGMSVYGVFQKTGINNTYESLFFNRCVGSWMSAGAQVYNSIRLIGNGSTNKGSGGFINISDLISPTLYVAEILPVGAVSSWSEWLICNGQLSDNNRKKIEGYLSHKWGLTNNLQIDHPYKYSKPTI